MKVIIAGSRTIRDPALVLAAITSSQFPITEVVCGRANGVDQLGMDWATSQHPPIPVREFPADWKRFGKSAGKVRNWEMARYAEGLIAVQENKSRGTAHMIEIAKRQGLKVFVKEVAR